MWCHSGNVVSFRKCANRFRGVGGGRRNEMTLVADARTPDISRFFRIPHAKTPPNRAPDPRVLCNCPPGPGGDRGRRDHARPRRRGQEGRKGLVVFRVPEIGPELLRLRTVEDVFLLAWGTDSLTYKADDLKSIRHWTAKEADWQHLLALHHAIRPKPKGKPSYRLVTQMSGTHGYRRIDAGKAMAQGLAGVFPAVLEARRGERRRRSLADHPRRDGRLRAAAVRQDHAASRLQGRASAGVAAADDRGGDGPAGRGRAGRRRPRSRCAGPGRSWPSRSN